TSWPISLGLSNTSPTRPSGTFLLRGGDRLRDLVVNARGARRVNRGETHDVVALAADDRVRRIMFTGIFSVLGTVVLIFVVTRWAERAAAPVIARGWTSRFGEAGQIALFRDGHHIRWKRHPVKIGLDENL